MGIDKQVLAKLRAEKQNDEIHIKNLKLDLAAIVVDADKRRIREEIDQRESQKVNHAIEIEALVKTIRQNAALQPRGQLASDECFRVVHIEDGIDPVDIMGFRAKQYYNKGFYLRRAIDKHIADNLSAKKPVLLVTGNPLAGKSRAVLEALERLRATSLILTDMSKVSEPILLPNAETTDVIAYVDDIDEKLLKFRETTNTLLREFIQKRIKPIVTCRRGPELDRLRSDLDSDLYLLFSSHKIEIEKLSDEQLKSVKNRSNTELVWGDFDGNIGSLVMPLQAMRNRYNKLREMENKLPALVLLALKCHYYQSNFEGNRSTYSVQKIWEFCERYWGQGRITRPLWDEAIASLIDEEFRFNFIECEGEWIRTEEVYLDQSKKVIAPEYGDKWITNIVRTLFKTPQERRHFGFPCTIKDFGRLMNQSVGFEDALSVFKQAILVGLEPNQYLYTLLIKRAPEYSTAILLLQQMIETHVTPNDWTYNTLIDKAPDFMTALSILTDMKKAEVKANNVTFTTLIKKAPDYSTAARLFQQMTEAHIAPTVRTYNTLIDKAPDFPTASLIFTEMKKAEIEPDDGTFTFLMKKAPDYPTAVGLFKVMTEAHIPPNEWAYCILIDKAPTFSTAMSIFDQIPLSRLESLKRIDGSLVRSARQNPVAAFEYIISKYPVEMVFSNRLLNTIIQVACLEYIDRQDFFDRFFPIIKEQADDIISYYARRYELLNNAQLALLFLDVMKEKGFDYFNIRGNCLQSSDPQHALLMYKSACNVALEGSRRRVGLYNLARLIYNMREQNSYPDAIAYCIEAITLVGNYSDFPFPTRLLYLLTIRMTKTESLLAEITRLKGMYPLGKGSIKEILGLIEGDDKKVIFAEYFPISTLIDE